MSHLAILTVTQILANKIVIKTFKLLPLKYRINHTAAMRIFYRQLKSMMAMYEIIKNFMQAQKAVRR